VEIELVDEEPLFLQGQLAAAGNLSPVKIVKNPEGSLARAALTQSQLARERRELREQQKSEQYLSAPKGIYSPLLYLLQITTQQQQQQQ
jgi:ATP-dependent RNA helicase DHX8/PRP22